MITTLKKPKRNNIKSYLDGKMILVTGGTGSFGKKFIEKALKSKLKRLVVFSRDELKQEEMRSKHGFTDKRLRYFIGDVRDKDRLSRAMIDIDIVIHAAALKQVPTAEYNPMEAIKTNVMGSANVIDVAIDRGVNKVINISTDKIVNPINLYGATKLLAEKLFIQGNNYSSQNGTKFGCVRFGNFVGSRGSVIPNFQYLNKVGKDITLTDRQMTRFWLTLDKGVEVVLQALLLLQGGEIFVPIMPSMKILDLAKTLAPESKIKIIGIRPGERLHEILISEEEKKYTYEYKNMYIIKPVSLFHESRNPIWTKAKHLNDGIDYSSNNNTKWLSNDDLLQLIKQ